MKHFILHRKCSSSKLNQNVSVAILEMVDPHSIQSVVCLLLTVGCPIFLIILIAKYLFTRSLKIIDQLIFRNAKEIYFNEKFPIL